MSRRVLALFDVDGTLTVPRKTASQATLDFLQELKKYVKVGIVGGSDLFKIQEQLGDNLLTAYDYVFSENGLVAHKAGEQIAVQSLKLHLGENKLKKFINFVLHHIADLDIPIKRGTFIEFRNGMLNVSPIGRNCSQQERDAFEVYDKTAGVRYVLSSTGLPAAAAAGNTITLQPLTTALITNWQQLHLPLLCLV
eukprot:GHRR01021440.1.p1 GENE.GHRR01021440.1~~GHRR01021440.1.p1  ORF type:complete len:195 (+),score=60.69 GHRR01021440.1:115-699(+)